MKTNLCLVLSLFALAAAAWTPYPVLPADGVMRSYPLRDAEGRVHGHASVGWTPEALVFAARITDANVVTPADAKLALKEAYRADSVEFWVNRRQFVCGDGPDGVAVWDYLYQELVPGATGSFERTETGYVVEARLPWAALGIDPAAGRCFQWALQVNDRRQEQQGERWKDVVRQTLFPAGATWDRPGSYATVCLAKQPRDDAAAMPTPFASLECRSQAWQRSTDFHVRRLAVAPEAALQLRLRHAGGKLLSETEVPPGAGTQLLEIPFHDGPAGIRDAELWLVVDGAEYGPVVEHFFDGGDKPIAEYRSPRQAPADLAEFWTAKVLAMREVPFATEALPGESPWPGIATRKVRIANHRGHPMTVSISRHRADEGPLPVLLNVYPPVRSEVPVRGRRGFITLTFCGSLQGENRLPDQESNAGLWDRIDDLDDCYWLDVVLDGVRALDWAAAAGGGDGRALVTGGSRGGWYAFALAAVEPDRVTVAHAAVPCYSDVTMNMKLGHGSAATEIRTRFVRDRDRLDGREFANFRYFDPLFLATIMRTRIAFNAGLQDPICSAIGMIGAAANITHEDTYFTLNPELGHGGDPNLTAFFQLIDQPVE